MLDTYRLKTILMSAILGIALLPSVVFAAPETQYDMDIQAQKQLDKADLELNKVYKQLLKSKPPATVKRLRKSERIWLKYRDSEAAVESAGEQGGSIYPMVYSDAMCELTKKRIKVLKAELKGP